MFNFTTGNGFLMYLVVAAGLLHACLQLPLATLTHTITHQLGKNKRTHILPLALLFIIGFLIAIGSLAIFSLALLWQLGTNANTYITIGALLCVAGVGIMVAYFRPESGAALWVPRRFVQQLYTLSEQGTTLEVYANVALTGFLSVWYEALFGFPLVLCALAISLSGEGLTMPEHATFYALAASAPLIFAAASLASGTSPVTINRWRIEGKRFWQFFLGFIYICFGLYVASGQFVVLH